jgi:hypothetical protein
MEYQLDFIYSPQNDIGEEIKNMINPDDQCIECFWQEFVNQKEEQSI